MNLKNFLHRTAAVGLITMMLFAALPAAPAGATSLDITSIATGTWESTAWPDTLRSGTITATAASQAVTGTGTAFTTELSIGNKLKITTGTQIGTVLSIEDDTHLTLVNPAAQTRTDIAYHVQGVGPFDNAIIDNGHTVSIAANAVNQSGTVTVNAGGTLVVSDVTDFSTLTVDGTVSATSSTNFGELIVNNGGIVTAAGTGATTAYSAASLTINSGGSLTLSRNFTVDSAAIISGTINFSSNSVSSRAMTFLGPVTLNSGATWNEPTLGNGANNTYNFSDNLTNNATVFTASPTSEHAFGGNAKTINGSSDTAIAKVKVDGTYTNNGILTVGDLLSGLGTLTNSASGTLNVQKAVTINTLANAGTMNKTGDGAISTPLTNTGTLNLNGTGTITSITNDAGGTVNLTDSGSIGTFNNATATSVLNIIDLTPSNITTFTISAPGNTVRYSGEGDQAVKSVLYSNLVLSGSGNKIISLSSNSTLTTGNLSIAPTGTAKASISGLNLTVDSLTLGGFGKINGTWGSTGSVATNKDDTFFAGIGYVNVTTDSRAAQTISFTSTPPANAAVGGTYTPTATATSGLTVTFTIDASAASVCSINAGLVTFNANGTCVINANQAGNANYQAAPQIQQSITVKTNQTIQFTSSAPTGAVIGDTYTPTATATSGLPVTLTITASSSSICSINAGLVTFNAAGTCVIKASQPGNASFNPAPPVQQSVVVHVPHTDIHVTMGGTAPAGSPFTLLQGTAARKSYAGIDKGPVKVRSANPAAPFVVSERVIFKFNGVSTSFSELMGLPNNQLHNVYWLPWYDNKTMSTQLRFANVSATTATIRVSIGGQVMPGSPFTLGPGLSVSQVHLVNQGPVKITSNVDILASQRVIHKANGANTSFSEMIAFPADRVNKVFWLPWYTNNQTVNTQLQITNASATAATVRISIGGQLMPGSPFPLGAGQSVRKTFAGIDKGPVKIQSNVNILASEQVIQKVAGVPVSLTEVMGLPNSQADTKFWMPWYTQDSTTLTQLRVGNVSASPATVHVYIKGVEVAGSPFNLAVGASKRLSIAGIDKGPVQIVSNVKVVASAGLTFKVGGKITSYSEMMALPNKLLDSIYWLPWYNHKSMNSQLRFGMP